MRGGLKRRQRVRDGEWIKAKFRYPYKCISCSELTSRGREEWPDKKKDEQEYKLQDKRVETRRERKETKVCVSEAKEGGKARTRLERQKGFFGGQT